MERLTRRYIGGEAYVSMHSVAAAGEYECVGPAITRLAAYEDIGLEPANLAKAVTDLRTRQEVEKNEPMTLDELREMDGEPVWIVEYPDWGHWELSADAEDYLIDREEAFYGMKHNDPLGRDGLHKLGWLAYRRKPKEAQE